MKEVNAIPADQLKAAVVEINKLLDKKIVLVGKKKSAVCQAFNDAIVAMIEEDTTDQLPESVIDFYNDFIADEEEEKQDEKPVGKGGKKSGTKTDTKTDSKKTDGKKTGTKTDGKKTDGKKTGTKTDSKKTGTRSKFPREKSVVMAIKKGGTYDAIVTLADSIYVENGGESNKAQSKKLVDRGLKYLEYAEVLVSNNGKFSLK